MRNDHSNDFIVKYVGYGSIAAGNLLSSAVDTGQFNSLTFVVTTAGTVTGGLARAVCEVSDDNATWAEDEKTTSYIAEQAAVFVTNGGFTVSSVAKSRYVRLKLVPAAGTSASITISALLGDYQGLAPGTL